jgi:hypothetical protein
MNTQEQQGTPIFYMSCNELIMYLQKELRELRFSDYIIKIFIKQEIDGKSFLLMRKKDFVEMNIMDKYNILCLIVPSALFVDGYI